MRACVCVFVFSYKNNGEHNLTFPNRICQKHRIAPLEFELACFGAAVKHFGHEKTGYIEPPCQSKIVYSRTKTEQKL